MTPLSTSLIACVGAEELVMEDSTAGSHPTVGSDCGNEGSKLSLPVLAPPLAWPLR